MQTGANNGYTRKVLEEVAEYKHTAEYVVIHELCALYDHFCDCPAVAEQRIYIKKRIEHYKALLKI